MKHPESSGKFSGVPTYIMYIFIYILGCFSLTIYGTISELTEDNRGTQGCCGGREGGGVLKPETQGK